jgi:hypothetical protein
VMEFNLSKTDPIGGQVGGQLGQSRGQLGANQGANQGPNGGTNRVTNQLANLGPIAKLNIKQSESQMVVKLLCICLHTNK